MLLCLFRKSEEVLNSKPGWIPQTDSEKGVSLQSYEHVPIASIPPMHAAHVSTQDSPSSKPSVSTDTLSEVSESKSDSDDGRKAPGMDVVRILPPGMVALPQRTERHRHSGRFQQPGYGSSERPTSVRRSGPPVASKLKDRYSNISSGSSPLVAAVHSSLSATEATTQGPYSATEPELSPAGHVDMLTSTDGRNSAINIAGKQNVQPPKRTISQQEKDILDSMMDELASTPTTQPSQFYGPGQAGHARSVSLKGNRSGLNDEATVRPSTTEVIFRNNPPAASVARQSLSEDV